MSKNIILCGVGGQGTILASRLIATAAMDKNIPIKTAETIGMAQRGGSVFSHLRLGEGTNSPLIGKGEVDLIIGFEPGETVRQLPFLKKGGAVVVSSRPVMPVSAMIGQSKYDAEAMIEYLRANVEHLTIGYDRPLCTVDKLEVRRGERLAIIGPNGGGKSTFVKTLMDLIPSISGSYLYGHQIEAGYFDQQLAQFTSGKTVLEELWDQYPDLDRTQIRTVLGSFLFSADDVFKSVDVLSGGEKVRLSLASLLLKHSNLLILDEPTNHLDIPGKEALEDSLKGYSGTIIFVSHDRYFIEQLATAILLIEDGKATYYPMGYDAYEEARNGVVQETPKKQEKAPEPVPAAPKEKQLSPDGVKREIAKLEKQITAKEEELEANRALRYEPEYYQDYQKMNALDQHIDDIHNELAHLYDRWEKLSS